MPTYADINGQRPFGRTADAQKERDTFARLDSQARAKNQGTQAVGGVGAPAPTPAPPQR